MPFDPTNENLSWLEKFTKGSGISVSWIGRVQLDSWAADNPQLVDYYFGDGGRQAKEFFTQALALAKTPDDIVTDNDEGMLNALLDRAGMIGDRLNDVDPFYRYEYECRQGSVDEVFAALQGENARPGETIISVTPYRRTGQCLVLRVIARCSESARFRPIKMGVEFHADEDSREHVELENFLKYGLPPQAISAKISSFEGPPGGPSTGPAIVSLFNAQNYDSMLPPLEISFVPRTNDSSSLVLPVKDLDNGVGINEDGSYLRFSDVANVFTVTMLMAATKEKGDLSVTRLDLTGRRPQDIFSSLEFLVALANGGELELRVRDGGLSLVRIAVNPSEDRRIAGYGLMREYVGSLAEIQKHVLEPVFVPAIESISDIDVRNINRVARLLRGEQVTGRWDKLEITVGDPEVIRGMMVDSQEGALLQRQNLIIDVGGRKFDTGHILQTLWKSVRTAEEYSVPKLAKGDRVQLVPGSEPEVVWMVGKGGDIQ